MIAARIIRCQRRGRHRVQMGLRRLLPPVVEVAPVGRPIKPASHLLRVAQRGELAPGDQERVLRQVLGRRRAQAELPEVAVHTRKPAPDHGCELLPSPLCFVHHPSLPVSRVPEPDSWRGGPVPNGKLGHATAGAPLRRRPYAVLGQDERLHRALKERARRGGPPQARGGWDPPGYACGTPRKAIQR